MTVSAAGGSSSLVCDELLALVSDSAQFRV